MRSVGALKRQMEAARSPDQRAPLWRAAQQLAATAERLLRLLPKLQPDGVQDAAALSPSSVFTGAAACLAETASALANDLGKPAVLAQRTSGARLKEAPAADAAEALADLGFTLSKRTLLWASQPRAQPAGPAGSRGAEQAGAAGQLRAAERAAEPGCELEARQLVLGMLPVAIQACGASFHSALPPADALLGASRCEPPPRQPGLSWQRWRGWTGSAWAHATCPAARRRKLRR